MGSEGFHKRSFDEGTLTKLEIFELYTREWIPVFLSSTFSPQIRIFDFFAGPGTDAQGTYGSPLRILRQLKSYSHLPNWGKTLITTHFFDDDSEKRLSANIERHGLKLPAVKIDARPLPFAEAFSGSASLLSDRRTAKLLFLDQFGVAHVTAQVFEKLLNFPICDFLFFLSSSTLNRFRDHPLIKQKIDRPDDYYHVHRAAVAYYRDLIPPGFEYYLAPFSIKKGPNIYGIIFGSGHPRGIDKFLEVAWKKDAINGEADFDINRDNLLPGEQFLPIFQPSKITAFTAELKADILQGKVRDERDVILSCFKHGVRRKHAEAVLSELKGETIECEFRVPDIERMSDPRVIQFK